MKTKHTDARKSKHNEAKKEAVKPQPKPATEKPDLTYNGIVNGQ